MSVRSLPTSSDSDGQAPRLNECRNMQIYHLINDLTHHPTHWVIERSVPRGMQPIRLRFTGTREQAQAEADRLNLFVRRKADDANSWFGQLPVSVYKRSS